MGNRNSCDTNHIQDRKFNSVGKLQAGIKDVKAKQKICEPSIKKPRKTRKHRNLSKTKSTRVNFNALKELYGDKMPVMLAFITSESECRLRLAKKPIKYTTALDRCASAKSCRNLLSSCSKYCKDCRKLSSQCVY